MAAEELNPEKRAKIAELKRQIRKPLPDCRMPSTYHMVSWIRYGIGSRSPTLGAGVAALFAGDTIIYPYCYRTGNPLIMVRVFHSEAGV